MSQYEYEKADQQAMRLANVGQTKEEAVQSAAWERSVKRSVAKNMRQFRKINAVRFWGKVFLSCLGMAAFAVLDMTDQIAGWIANLGACGCMVCVAITIDRFRRFRG